LISIIKTEKEENEKVPHEKGRKRTDVDKQS
jgi:hypothetical protein